MTWSFKLYARQAIVSATGTLATLSIAGTNAITAPTTDTLTEWQSRRSGIRHEWMQVLGPSPQRCPLAAQIVSTVNEPGHVRKLVRYQTEPGIVTDAYLLVPNNVFTSAPAAVVFHGTSSNHILQPVGLADAPTRHIALNLVRRGWITLSPRCFINGTADVTATTAPITPAQTFSDYTSAAHALLQRRPDWSGMGKMLNDGMRAVDYLATIPQVDQSRIACLGHSLGAKEALYLVAFDDRVAAAICSEGGIGLQQSNWDAPWYLGSRIPDPLQHDHHELLMLAAPRTVIIIGGGFADGKVSRPIIDRARPVYNLCGTREALVLQLHNSGHDLPSTELNKALDQLNFRDNNSTATDRTNMTRHSDF
jgi:dienelactone hydrolase